jgi:mannose-6-phosphate isomerase-like protein (cupin superfamily)
MAASKIFTSMILCMSAVTADAGTPPSAGLPSDQPASRTRIVPASELTWTDVMDPNGLPLGLRTVDVWGNARQSAHGSLTKFPAGFAEPLHRHSNPIRVIVLSGIMRFVVDGVESVDLGPGSYVSISADVPHFARCAGTAPCEVLIEQDAAMDVKLGAK